MRNHCIVTGCVTFHRLTNDLYWRLRRFFTMHLLHNHFFDAIGTMSDAWITVSSIIDWWLTCPWAMHLCNYPPSIDWVFFSLNNKSAFPMKFFYKCAAMKLSVESYKINSFCVILITTGDESSRTTCSKQQKTSKKKNKKMTLFYSDDGIHWRPFSLSIDGEASENCACFAPVELKKNLSSHNKFHSCYFFSVLG